MNCEICGASDKETRIIKSKKYGCLCRKHYLRKYKNKNINRSIYDPNTYEIYDTYAEIVLYDRNGNECGRAIIDIEDVELCKKYKWHIKRDRRTSYAISNGESRVFLHRLVMNYSGNDDVDHINRNGLDNRKSNLRIVTRSANIMNQDESNGIKKVPSGNYQVAIGKDYKTIYIGTYSSFEDAYNARKNAEEKYK